MRVSPTHYPGKSKRGFSKSYRTTWPEWRCSRSTPVAASRKSAVFAGNGKSKYRNWIPLSFLIPEERVKNGEERLVVLNRVAMIHCRERRRGEHRHACLHLLRQAPSKMNNSAWRKPGRKSGYHRSESTISSTRLVADSSCRSIIRGQAGLARTPLGTDYEPLLGG